MNAVNQNRINRLFFVLTWLGSISYIIERSLLTKIPASSCFFLLGCLNVLYFHRHSRASKAFPLTMLAGLFLGLAADIGLELDFLTGAALFALGHLLYLAAYCCLIPFHRKDTLVSAALFLPCLGLILFLPSLDFGSTFMQTIVIVYTVFICLMLGKAVSNFLRRPDSLTKQLLLGSVLFFFSDFMLLFAFFTDAGRITNILCLNTYYPGQALLAWCIFRFASQD